MGIIGEEVVKKEHPDNFDAELLLRLYDLRRESQTAAGARVVHSGISGEVL
jgi:hypothetical protein